MRRCQRCTLPETFPGAAIDGQGVCRYCRQARSPKEDLAQRGKLEFRFSRLVERLRGRQSYDCLVSWSGGKDSTYVLTLLKQDYGLRPLAVTFDNGFLSPQALDNCRTVANQLGVDHIIVAPKFDLLRRLFVSSVDSACFPRVALRRASSICNACMGMNKLIALQLAQEKKIPFLAYGWSPGQIPIPSALLAYTPSLLQTILQSTAASLQRLAGETLQAYLPDTGTTYPIELYSVSPLGFLRYDEVQIRRRISGLGWKPPDDTGPNSSNCLLNALASSIHYQQFGYHPYDMELATLVRMGCIARGEALRRLEVAPDPALVASIRTRLGL